MPLNKKIGILGGGQLGRMFIENALSYNVNVSILDPAANAPCQNIADHFTQGSFKDFDTVVAFAKDADVVTIEIEHVNTDALKALEEMGKTVIPSAFAIETIKDKGLQKTFYKENGIVSSEFVMIENKEDLKNHLDFLPAFQKARTEGYDGKGQFVLREPADATAAWAEIGNRELIAEAFVPFIREVSVIGCRAENGDIKVWPMTENIHHEGILRYSLYPAHGFSAEKQAIAERYIEQIATSLDYVGTITLELFETEDNLIANEVAPRVHNSGHWSIEGAVTSQFRNHMLAVTGQAITETESKFPAVAMINVISDEGPTSAAAGMSQTYVHSYGKEARPARKLGHVTITAADTDERDSKISQLEGLIPAGVWSK